MHDTAYRITDLNGEHYKFKEAAFVEGRLMQNKIQEYLPISGTQMNSSAMLGLPHCPLRAGRGITCGTKRLRTGGTGHCAISAMMMENVRL